VHEIFTSIQGEGMMTGVPMTFIRLFGCNMDPRCSFCDTPQDKAIEMTVSEIVELVTGKWVCITGGEPTIHTNLRALTEYLHTRGHLVALETNGTGRLPGWTNWICVSPKSIWPATDVLVRANEIKLLVGSGMYDVEEAVERCTGSWLVKGPYRVEPTAISLQPVWDDSYEANLQEAIRLCQKHQLRLSVQVHKYLGVK
jgi:7-carboxy-7-deazaguanine synthase